ncbi:Fic family protein [Candidatus Bipolaricaulota bacterium]
MNSMTPQYLDQLTYREGHLKTIGALRQHKGEQERFRYQTPETLETLRTAALIESTESSNRLEGITADRARIVALALHSTNPANRPEQEIAGYRDALALVHESYEHMEFTPNVILQCHGLMMRYTDEIGGRWKTRDNSIVERAADGKITRVRFEPVSALKTPDAMQELTELFALSLSDGREPLVTIPLTILDFLCIHPFKDGNGRCSRLLTLQLLYKAGYSVGKYISLERIFERTSESYYEVLEKSSQGWHEGKHDPFPWMTYFWGVLIAASKEFRERAGTIRKLRGAKTEQIKAWVERQLVPFAISDVDRDCPGISREMIRLVLNDLREQGTLRLEGRGRGAKWHRIIG